MYSEHQAKIPTIGSAGLRIFYFVLFPIVICAVGCEDEVASNQSCLLYTSPSPRDATLSRMPSSA